MLIFVLPRPQLVPRGVVAQGRHPDRLFTVCYLPTQLATLAVVMLYHTQFNSRLRIILGLAGFCIAMVAIPALNAGSAGQGALVWVLLLVASTGFADGIAQSALYGEAALLPPVYTQVLLVLSYHLAPATLVRREQLTCEAYVGYCQWDRCLWDRGVAATHRHQGLLA